jgi:hypothetical protein
MQLPVEMLIEYVRVYQCKGQTNIGRDPPNYPTANYIQNHLNTYSSTSGNTESSIVTLQGMLSHIALIVMHHNSIVHHCNLL